MFPVEDRIPDHYWQAWCRQSQLRSPQHVFLPAQGIMQSLSVMFGLFQSCSSFRVPTPRVSIVVNVIECRLLQNPLCSIVLAGCHRRIASGHSFLSHWPPGDRSFAWQSFCRSAISGPHSQTARGCWDRRVALSSSEIRMGHPICLQRKRFRAYHRSVSPELRPSVARITRSSDARGKKRNPTVAQESRTTFRARAS